ncbi:hypothetical protein [Saccharopolyspora sp. CA-218241]|uniref:hypothetical protein n=1 Tax=Saccharopolyspora sp. CA-218241 TaxID=3240027 RepID=UPI003D9724C3
MARARNDRLRAAREATPSPRVPGDALSRAELAEAVNTWVAQHARRAGALDVHYIARLERGAVRCPGRDYRAGFRAVLGAADDAELGFAAITPPAAKVLIAPESAELAETGSPPMADPDAPAASDYLDEMRRTISHLVALDGVHGGAEVASIALRCFRRAQRILAEGHYLPTIERDLEAVTAELGELSGWLLFDAERHDEARAVNAEALELAHVAGDASMQWFILTNQALASVHVGRDREALRISTRMSDRADLPGRVRALFDVRAARALASLGDETGALRVFDRARSAFTGGTTGRDPVWSWWFDERELAGHEGMVHASLGNHAKALPRLATAVERSTGREHFRWALYIHRANLLRAYLRAGSWFDAEQVAVDVAPMVGEIASARTEGILHRTVAIRDRPLSLPSTLSDALDHIARRIS